MLCFSATFNAALYQYLVASRHGLHQIPNYKTDKVLHLVKLDESERMVNGERAREGLTWNWSLRGELDQGLKKRDNSKAVFSRHITTE